MVFVEKFVLKKLEEERKSQFSVTERKKERKKERKGLEKGKLFLRADFFRLGINLFTKALE